MATGPEHYREAERLLMDISYDRKTYDDDIRAAALTRAQVHATLALAAATALNDGNVRAPIADCQEWVQVASVTAATTEQRSDAEILAEQRSIFGEPVEGRDCHAMPGTNAESEA